MWAIEEYADYLLNYVSELIANFDTYMNMMLYVNIPTKFAIYNN
jgi:hypothetical protein